MAAFKVTFEDRKGRKTTMTVEGLSTSDAKDNAAFFKNVYGQPVKAEPVKA